MLNISELNLAEFMIELDSDQSRQISGGKMLNITNYEHLVRTKKGDIIIRNLKGKMNIKTSDLTSSVTYRIGKIFIHD